MWSQQVLSWFIRQSIPVMVIELRALVYRSLNAAGISGKVKENMGPLATTMEFDERTNLMDLMPGI